MVTDDFYRALEDRFRGSRELIKQRQSVYLPLVEALEKKTGDKKILDVGCGRAEWLELLGDRNIAAEGLDLNEEFVKSGKEAGLTVFNADVMEYLRGQLDQAYGLISAFHVVEHLGFENLLLFLKEAFRVVDNNGAILLETPNPANLLVGACNFYLDPTHERPIPSMLLGFAAEFSGFERVVVVPVNRDFLRNDLELLPAELSGAAVVNTLVSSVNQNFMQAPDYAVVAFKKADNDLIRIAESLVIEPPLPISAKETEDVNELFARVLDAESKRVSAEAERTALHEAAQQAMQTSREENERYRLLQAEFNAVQFQFGEAVGRVNQIERRLIEAQFLATNAEEALNDSKHLQKLQELENELHALHGRAAAAEDLANRSQQHVIALLSSSSWRLSSPVRFVGRGFRKLGGSPGGVRRRAKLVLLHGVAYVRCRPVLKQRVANLLSRFPRVRARLVRLAGFSAAQTVVAGAALPVVETPDRLTLRGRKIFNDLANAKNANTK